MRMTFTASGDVAHLSTDAPTGAVVESGYPIEVEQLPQQAVQVMLVTERPEVGASIFGFKTMRSDSTSCVLVGFTPDA